MATLNADRRARLVPRIKIWLEIDGQYAFGFGLSEMLRAVDETGSIKQAAADLGKSYRYVWGRIKDAEKTLGRQLVETHVGGKDPQRSCLTGEARRFVADFQEVRRRMIRSIQVEFARRRGWRLGKPPSST
jgi:molybdate transport repressor ModE-like protein